MEGSGSGPAPLTYGSGRDLGGPKTYGSYGFRILNTGCRLGRICTSSFKELRVFEDSLLPAVYIVTTYSGTLATYHHRFLQLTHTQSHVQIACGPYYRKTILRMVLFLPKRGGGGTSFGDHHRLESTRKKGRIWPLSRVHSVMIVLPLSSPTFSLVTTMVRTLLRDRGKPTACYV